ncbi:MAG: ABC transporter permease [Synoicihabitans sp.]
MFSSLDRLAARIRAAFQKPDLDADFDAELTHHLEMLTDDYVAQGMTHQEARRRARLEMGGIEQTRELHRETRGLPWFEQLGLDLRYTARLFNRERSFSIIALTIIAIGVGLNTSVFSLVNTVLIRPLPFTAADQLIWITNGPPETPKDDLSAVTHLVETYEGLQESNRTLELLEAYEPFSLRHTYRLTRDNGTPETINSIMVSAGLFPMLGIQPHLGRFFTPNDAVPNGPPRIILSYQFWQQQFGGRPTVIGETVRINDTPVEILGVAPRLDPFAASFYPAVRIDCYSVLVNDYRRSWGNTLSLIGRIKPGTTFEQARTNLALAMETTRTNRPQIGDYPQANVHLLHDHIAGTLRQPLIFLAVAAGLLLAIVAFNLGGLLLARGAARAKELALRTALGAGNNRILRQLFTESAALVAVGATIGVVLAAAIIHLLAVKSSVAIPLLQSVRLDVASLGFTLLLAAGTALCAGLAPAWRLSFGRGPGFAALKDEGRGATSSRGMVRVRSALVITEIALACGLVITAGLVMRSLHNVLDLDLGYEPENLTALRIDLLNTEDGPADTLYTMIDRVEALPGVLAAGFTDCIPIERDRGWGISALDNPEDPDSRRGGTGAHVRIVSAGLLEAMNTPIVEGRSFNRTDGANREAIIINQTLARQFWPDGPAVGNYVRQNGNNMQVIGVAADVRHRGPEIEAGREMYMTNRSWGGTSWDLMIRSTLPHDVLMTSVRAALREIDPTLPLTQAREMTTLVDRANSARSLMASLVTGFAIMALGLAALGLYGVISYTVAQRRKEIGIRMALGATGGTVSREIVGRTLKLAAWGVAVGLLGALAAGRLMDSILFGVSSFDPQTYLITTISVIFCALLAGYLPARTASRFDPMHILRSD